MRRILVATDLSETSEAALQYAIEVARGLGGAVHLAFVQERFLEPRAVDDVPPASGLQKRELGRIHDELASRVARVLAAGVPCESTTLEGSPFTEIVNQAAVIGAELIVVGTHGRTGLRHALLGSVAERVVQKAGRPVLVVPPGWRERIGA